MEGVQIIQVELNIGLVNNPYASVEDYIELLRGVGLSVFDSGVEMGSYREVEIPTAVILCSSTKDEETVRKQIQKLAVIFNQDVIAANLNNGKGMMIYHPRYKGEVIAYDDDLFITNIRNHDTDIEEYLTDKI